MECKSDRIYSYLSCCGLGLAFGVLDGLFMLVYAWIAYFTGHGVAYINEISSFYCGYAPTIGGGLIGGLWGLVVGFIFGSVLAGIYNCCLCCCKKKCSSSKGSDGSCH